MANDDRPCICVEYADRDPSCPRHGGRGEFGMPTTGGQAVRGMPPGKFRAVLTEDGIECSYGDDGYAVAATTDDARWIMLHVAPGVLEKFLRKNTQYARAQTGHDLGVKGIIPDINRKTSALITRFWDQDGFPRGDEDSNEELLGDLIGHCLLMLAKLRDQ